MKFIVKGSNIKTVVMSCEFEELPKNLIVEIMRCSLASQASISSTPFAITASNNTADHRLEEHNLISDMKDFLTTHGKPFCDITLVLHGERIPAHKAILAARSKYFEAMFRHFQPKDGCVNVSL